MFLISPPSHPAQLSQNNSPILSTYLLILLITVSVISGCDVTDSDTSTQTFEYHFDESGYEWEGFFTGYNMGWEDDMELTTDYRNLPEPLDTTRQALYISALNQSDDVKMLFRKQVEGLEPNTTYTVETTLRFATDAPANCPGIGGPIGDAVNVIISADSVRPEAFVEDDYYLLNLQYQNEDSQEWYQSRVIGDIGNTKECGEEYEFELKELMSDEEQVEFSTDEQGTAWLLFGTRSGFEGRTSLYYTYFRADIRENG